MERVEGHWHDAGMAKKLLVSPYERKQYPLTKIRRWRKFHKLTLETVAGEIGMTPPALSLLERGLSGYQQATLELLSKPLKATPDELIAVDPFKKAELMDVVRRIKDKDHAQAVRVLKALADGEES